MLLVDENDGGNCIFSFSCLEQSYRKNLRCRLKWVSGTKHHLPSVIRTVFDKELNYQLL